MNIAFLGLGVMGRSMARHILQKNGSLTVWNRTASKADELAAEGASLAATPADAAREASIVAICVADTPDVEAVVFGEQGVFEGLTAGKLIIDFSTISASATEAFAEKVAGLGCDWVDAPVSGGDVGARNGTLSIMAGGAPEALARARPIFEMVGKKFVHMGGVGDGQRTKMANQIAVVGSIAAMGEALRFAQETGLDPALVLDAIGGGAAGSWSLANYGPRVLRGDFAPGFAASLQYKDLRLVLEVLAQLEPGYDMTQMMAEVYRRMVENGDGGEGNHAAVKVLGWKA